MDNEPESKIQQLMKRVLEPHFVLTETQLELLLKHLPDLCSDKTLPENFFIFWYKTFTENWKTTHNNISTHSIIVIINVTGIVCTQEQEFLNLNFTGIIEEVLGIIKILPGIQTDPLIQLYYIRLMKYFIKHKSGLQWLIASNHWHDIFVTTLNKTDELVFKEGCSFLVELLNKTKTDNEMFCCNVIKMLVNPLTHFSKRTNSLDVMEHDADYLDASKRLTILKNIFNDMFAICCTTKDFRFMDIMQGKFKIDTIFKDIEESEQPKEMYFQIYVLQCLVSYFVLAKNLKNEVESLLSHKNTEFNMFEARMYGILMKVSTRINEYSIILQILNEYLKCAQQMVKNVDFMKSVAIDYEYQVVAFLIYPMRQTLKSLVGYCVIRDDLQDEVSSDIMRKIMPTTFQAALKIKKIFTFEDALASLNYVQNYSQLYSHNIVICFAQMAVYGFIAVFEYLGKSSESISPKIEELLLKLLETMIFLFTEYDLTWKDAIEPMYIKGCVIEFLKLPNLSEKLVTRGLQLLNVAVRKNLSPGLHLLIDRFEEGDLNAMQEHFIPYFSDTNWEVRNAAVQVLHANVQTKKGYTNMITILSKFNFPELVLNRFVSDPEITVRISALRCFSDMLGHNDWWQNTSRIPDLHDKIFQMFYLESDGVIRSEAVILMTTLYEHQDLPEITEKLYDIMSYAVLEDPFYLVKVNALEFWKKVIDKQLTEEGMIDGEFPSVTFSKKLKKIITFDDYSIKKSLERVLNKLSETRGLAAFLFALNSPAQSNIEHRALKLLKQLILLMKKHYFIPASPKSTRRTSSVCSNSTNSPLPKIFDSPNPKDASQPNILNSPCPEDNLISSILDSPPPTNSSILLSPYPESLYEDIMDIQEPLTSDSSFLNTILTDSILDNPEIVLRNEFIKYVETFDCSFYDNIDCKDIDVLLKVIL